jgi:ankyrin repeat protein
MDKWSPTRLARFEHACNIGDVAAVIRYLRTAGDPNPPDGNGEPPPEMAPGPTPLVDALAFRRYELVRRLLAHGADPNQPGQMSTAPYPDLRTPLALAVEKDLPLDIIEALIDAGADLEFRGTQAATPLGFAVLGGSVDIMQLLVARGANKYAVTGMALSVAQPPHGDLAGKELRRMCLADAATLCRATHGRLGADSPASLLRGFPNITAFILDRANPVRGTKPIEFP